jgi:hypothetical protein
LQAGGQRFEPVKLHHFVFPEMKTTFSAVNAADLADLPPFFDIVNGFFNRCRGGMLHSHIFGCGWMTCCYKSK